MAQDLKIMDDFMSAKNRLKDYTDKNGYEKPVYETVSKRIDDFRKVYKVRVTIEGLVDATGEGYSRRLAEYRAAINAFEEILEVREEQQKSKEEELLAKEKKNGLNDPQQVEEVSYDTTDVSPVSNEVSAQQLNGDLNSNEDNSNDNDVNDHPNNSIIISADINTGAAQTEEVREENEEKLVNGHNGVDSKSQTLSNGSAINGVNDVKVNKSEENSGENSQTIKINGKRSEFMSATTVRVFHPMKKGPIQQLQDFCMEKQSPYPFYDTSYRDRVFLIKCRIEFTQNEEKREFYGTGSGNTSKEAKLMAAEDILQQLTALTLI